MEKAVAGLSSALGLSPREHLAIVTDCSYSMNEDYAGGLDKLQAAKRASISLVLEKDQIDPQDCVGVIAFDDSAETILNLSPLHSHATTSIS